MTLRRLSRRFVWRARGERTECPACGTTAFFDLDILPQRGRVPAFACACERCGLVFANPQPSEQTLEAFYSPTGTWVAPRDDADHRPVKGADASWVRRFDAIRSELRVDAPPAGARVLDFGCGDGSLLDSLRACGWATVGIEPATDVAFARHDRMHAVPAEPTFDLIIAHHVLEHVPNPLALLRQFAAAARPEAFLSVSVPRFDTLPIHRDYKYVLNGRAHIVAYTWPCLRTLLAMSGWQAVEAPPDRVGASSEQRMRRRLRVLARRTTRPADADPAPSVAAIAAVREYYRHADGRPMLARLGCLRLAARRMYAQRRRALAQAKVERAHNDVRA